MTTETVHKVTLSTGKIVLMRDMLIKHQELAASAVGNKYENAPAALQIAVQNELVRMLLVKVGDKEVKGSDSLDSLLTINEFKQCLKVVEQLNGGNESPLIEVVSSGSK